MNQELKQQWIDALLSDDSHQMIGGLRKVVDGVVYNDAWGLLMDLIVADPEFKILERDVNQVYSYPGGPWMRTLPSYELLEGLGIPYNAGPSADIRNYLAGLNDSGSNFIYIAGEVQEYVPSD